MSSILTAAEIHALVVYLDDPQLQRLVRDVDLDIDNAGERPEPKQSAKYKQIKKLLQFGNHPFPVLKFLLNVGLIKLALSDQERKPHAALYVPLCDRHIPEDKIKQTLPFDSILSCHDTFEQAADCTGKRGSVAYIDPNEMVRIGDWALDVQPKRFTLSLMVASVEWLTTAFHKEREYLFLGHLDFSLEDISDENESEQLLKMSYVKGQDLSLEF